MPPDLAAQLLKHWPDELSGLCVLEVGLSGGLDSMALLSLLCEARERRPQLCLSAVHVHHGLSPNADAWAEHCRRVCARLDVPLRVERVHLAVAGGESLEAVAREARYRVYRQSAAQVIALAHHLDDQAETVLLQLLRGGGARALAAMPAVRPLDGAGRMLWRPLLGHARAELEAYVRSRDLGWVEDESNQDTRYRRNLLRQDILPRIEQAIPHYRQHLARAASLQADAVELLAEVSAADLAACRVDGGLDWLRLKSLSPARQRHALLAWLQALGWPAPEPAALREFLRQLHQAGPEACPLLRLPAGSLLRFGGAVQAWPALAAPQATALPPLDPAQSLLLPSWGGRLGWAWRASGLDAAHLAGGLVLRPRQGGEKLPGRAGRRAVKDLLREAGLPPLLRQRWPLLYSGAGDLLAVPGVAVSQAHAAGPGWWPLWQAAGPEDASDQSG
nr:tRNA lysidine(34) synthetase TilS [Chromobacterium sp. ASV5]